MSPYNQLHTESEVASALNFFSYAPLVLHHYCQKHFSAINPDHFRRMHGKAGGKLWPQCATANQHLALAAKGTGTLRRRKVAP